MVAPWKIEYVNSLVDQLKNAESFAIANAMDVPSRSMQQIRKSLKQQEIHVKVVKKSLLIKALERLAQQNEKYSQVIEELERRDRITVTLLIPKERVNPFKLYKILDENKTFRAAKPGDVAPNEIKITAGPTPFTPGPVLTTLKKFGLKTKVEGGKIVITEDKVVAKKGDVITEDLAELLNKFGIEPIEVKLNVVLAYDRGIIYTEDVLSTPLEKYIEDLKRAFAKAAALSLEIGVPTRYTSKILLRRAIENAYKLSLRTGIPTKDTIKLILKKAINEAALLAQNLPEDIRPVKFEVQPQETPKQEETTEEDKPREEESKEDQAIEGLGALFGF